MAFVGGNTAYRPPVTLCLLLLTVTLFDESIEVTAKSTEVDSSLKFIKEPEDIVTTGNQSVVFDCAGYSAPEYEPLRFTWFHKGLLVNDGRRQILLNGSLYIRRVLYEKHDIIPESRSSTGYAESDIGLVGSDTGEYYCTISNSLGTLLSRSVQLSIASESRKFIVEPESVYAEEGDVVQLKCRIDANPIPPYFWQQAEQHLSSDVVDHWIAITPGNTRFTQLPNGTLQITGVVSSDGGRYRCLGYNKDDGRAASEAFLRLVPSTKNYRPPVLLTVDSIVTAMLGDLAILPCLASGYPLPVISWIKPDGHTVSPNLGQGNLELKNVSTSDEGDYVCTASNEFGGTLETNSVIQTVQFKVLVPPSFVERSQGIIGPLGITVRFECKVHGVPEPRVRWFKDGHPLESSRIKHKAGPYCSSLVILQTIMADAGIYQCMADNIVGYASVATRLQVNTSQNQPEPPMGLVAITRSSSSVELHWNASVTRNGLAIQAYTVHYFLASGGEENQKVTMNTTYLIENIQPYTNYTFYVRAYNGKSASEQSQSLTWATGEDVPLGFPTVTLSSIRTTLYISWDELPSSIARGVIVGYKIHWRLHMHGSTNVIEVTGDVTEFTVTGLPIGKRFEARVAACTSVGYPKLADRHWPWVSHEMARYVSVDAPLPPVLHLSVINSTAVSAKWKMTEGDDSNFILGYVLQYHKQNHRLSEPIKISVNTTQYLLTNLVPHTRYDVHIFAYNRNGDGGESVAGIDTLPDKQADEYPSQKWSVVEPPNLLVAKPTSSSTIHLTWRSPLTNKNVGYYTVRYNPVHNSSMVNSSMVSYIRSTSEEVVITDLLPYTQYEFSVRSHDQDNKPGPYSNKVECKTLEDAPTAPLNLQWKLLDPHTIRLMWQPPKYPNGVIISYDILYNTQMDPLFLLDKWSTIKEHGTESSSMVNGLVSNKIYYLCVRAETRAGPGTPTDVITFSIPAIAVKNDTYISPVIVDEFQDQKFGIIVGVSIGVCCMIICVVIIVCRNRCFPPPPERLHSRHFANGYSSRVDGSGSLAREYRISSLESHEMDSVTPMLINIPDTISSHLDTKGGYPKTTSCINGGTEHWNSSPPQTVNCNGQPNLCVNITENPQFCIKRSGFSSGDNNKTIKQKLKPARLSQKSPSSSHALPLIGPTSLERPSNGSGDISPCSTNDAPLTSSICDGIKNGYNLHDTVVHYALAKQDLNDVGKDSSCDYIQGSCSDHGTQHEAFNDSSVKFKQRVARGGKRRSKSGSINGVNRNGLTNPLNPSSNSSATFIQRQHCLTNVDPYRDSIPTSYESGKIDPKDYNKRRPLSRTAISATPIMVANVTNGTEKKGNLSNGLSQHSGCLKDFAKEKGERPPVQPWHSQPSLPLSSSSSPTLRSSTKQQTTVGNRRTVLVAM